MRQADRVREQLLEEVDGDKIEGFSYMGDLLQRIKDLSVHLHL